MSNKEFVEARFNDLKNNLDTAQLCLNNVYQDLARLKGFVSNHLDEETEEDEDCSENDKTLEEIIKEMTDKLDKTYGSKISIIVKEVK